MSPLKPLIECCITPVAPEYFLWRLHEYAKTQNIPLTQAAHDILPFSLVYNCVLFTTILGCILERPDLISPAVNAYIYREPLLRTIKAYPELQKQLPTIVKKSNHHLTKHVMDMVITDKFAHLLLAHCGIQDTTEEDDALYDSLRLNTPDRAYLLEQCVAENSLPTEFINNSSINCELLPIEKLNHFLALIFAADKYDVYFSPEILDSLLRHLAKQPLQAGFAMHVLACNPTVAASAFMRQRHNRAVNDLCEKHLWQLGFAMQQVHARSGSELQQLAVWIVSNFILSNPITLLHVAPDNLEKALDAARSHPELRLRYDNNSDLQNGLRTLVPQTSALILNQKSLEKLLSHIQKSIDEYMVQCSEAPYKNLLRRIREECVLLFGVILTSLAIFEMVQFLLQVFMPHFIIWHATCDYVDLGSIYYLCMSCRVYDHRYAVESLPRLWMETNPWLQLIYEMRTARPEYCAGLAENKMSVQDYLDNVLMVSEPLNDPSQTVNIGIFVFYFMALCCLGTYILRQNYIVPYHALLDTVIEKMKIFSDLMAKTQQAANLLNIKTYIQQLQSAAIIGQEKPQKLQRLITDLVWNLRMTLKYHPVQIEIRQNAVGATLDSIHQAPNASYVISQTLWQENRVVQQPQIELDVNDRMYHVI